MKRKLLLYMLSIAMSFALMSSNCGEDPPEPGTTKGKVSVTVLKDVDGTPAAGAKIKLFYTLDSMNTNRPILSSDADAAGKKLFENVVARNYYVMAELGDATASQQINVPAGQTADVTLRVKDVGHLRVNVKVGSVIGNAAGGAEVGVAWTLDSAAHKMFIRPSVLTPNSGENIGRVIISDLPRREYYVYAELGERKGIEAVTVTKPNSTNPYTDLVIAVKQ